MRKQRLLLWLLVVRFNTTSELNEEPAALQSSLPLVVRGLLAQLKNDACNAHQSGDPGFISE